MLFRLALAFTATLTACTAVLCQGQTKGAPSPASMAAANSSQTPEFQTRDPRYVIHRMDVLTLGFPIAPEFNETVTVQPDGYINLISAKSIHVEGLTVPQAEAALKDAYASTLRNPLVTIDLKDFQKPLFTVTGQVGKPGQYELRQSTTVVEAIAVAGGLAPTSTTHIYLFHHTPSGSFNVEKLDLKQVMSGKNLTENSEIHPGDMVVVPESNLTKFKKVVPYSFGGYISPNLY
jgi:polysaccharide biosynthesis/export protein